MYCAIPTASAWPLWIDLGCVMVNGPSVEPNPYLAAAGMFADDSFAWVPMCRPPTWRGTITQRSPIGTGRMLAAGDGGPLVGNTTPKGYPVPGPRSRSSRS